MHLARSVRCGRPSCNNEPEGSCKLWMDSTVQRPSMCARIFLFFSDGMKKFSLLAQVESIPVHLHLFYILFSVGLLDFLFNVNLHRRLRYTGVVCQRNADTLSSPPCRHSSPTPRTRPPYRHSFGKSWNNILNRALSPYAERYETDCHSRALGQNSEWYE